MTVSVEDLTEFGIVKLLNSSPWPVVCLDIIDGPCYLVAPRLKKRIKETERTRDYPRFKTAAVDIKALDSAFMYYDYELN